MCTSQEIRYKLEKMQTGRFGKVDVSIEHARIQGEHNKVVSFTILITKVASF